MRGLLFCFLLSLVYFTAKADRYYSPQTSSSISGTTSYCQNASASAITFTYNSCVSGSGGVAYGNSMTVYWYRNTTNSTTGGTLVATTSATSVAAATGSVSYTPVTTSAGTFYYYCIISYTATGTCGTGGTLTSGTAQVTVIAPPGPITGTLTVAPAASVTLSDSASGGTWSTSAASIATINATTGVVTGVANGSAVISYTTGCGTAVAATVTVMPSVTWYRDAEGDGWGNPLIYQTVAGRPSGYVQNKQDINDANINTSAWYNIGSAGFAFNGGSVNTTNHKIVFDNTGVPYVYYLLNTSNSWVQKYSGGAWTVVGGSSFTGNVSYASMAMSSTNVPYVAYQDGYNASCKKFDGSSWVQVGSANFTANGATYESLALDNSDVPYMAYRDNNVSNKASVMKFNGTSWVQVGSAGFSAGAAAFTSIAIDLYNNIYVAYQDANSSSKVSVMKFNGSSWSLVGSAGFSAGAATYVSMAVDRSGTPYVVYNDAGNSNKATVMKYNGSSWVTVGSAGFSAGTANYTDIEIDAAGTPYVSYSDASLSNKAVVMKFDGSSWSAVVSSTGFTSGAAPYVAMALNKEGVPAVFFQDGANSNKGSAMYLAPVKVMPTQPVITASPSYSCGSTTVSLTVSSGTLNDATSWVWYKGSCGGTYVGTGSTITLSVSSTTNFYCRGENNYFTTQGDCGYAKVTIKTNPTWYQDADGDGWGNASVSLTQCSQPAGYVLNSSDCTDGSTTNTVAYSYGSAGISSSTATYTNLLFDNSNTPYIYFLNNGSSSSVYKYSSGTWTAVGSTGFTGNVSYGSMAINSTGNLYVAYQDGYQASCKRFNGTDWEQVGSANFSSGGATYTSLAIDNSDVPYVAFVENYYMWTNKASVMKYNGASWSYVGGGGITANTANYTSLAVDAGGALYLAYQDGSSNKATVMKYASGAWSVLGSANFSDGNATNIAIAVDDNGTPYVLYSDASYSGKAIVKKYNGSAWVNVGASSGISSGSTSYTSIKLDAGGNPYISYTDAGISNKASVMKFNGTSWVSVTTSAGFTSGTSSHSSLAIDAYGIPYLSVQDASTSSKATVYKAAPVSVNPTTPTVSASSTSISCGSTVTLTVSGTLNNATGWRWYTDTSGSGTSIGSGATFTVSPTATGTRYYVRGEGPCLTNQGSFAGSPAITVTGGITGPTDISGTSPICRAATATYTSTASGTGVTTAWSSSNTSVASVNASTGVVTGISAGTATITFTASSAGCGSVYKTKSVTVVRTPSVITGTQAVCVGGLTALSDSVSGGTWSSSNTGVATVVSTTGIVSGVSAGTTNISYSVTNACGTNAVGRVVTVNAAPTVAGITANPTNYCMGAGGAITLTAGSVTGSGTLTSYNWSGPLGYSATSATSSTSFTPTNSLSSGYYQLSVTYPGSGCTSSSVTSDYVTISPNPTVYSVTGGTGCSYPGVAIGLSGSQTGISYQLYRGAVAVGSPIAGTGSALSFGTQTVAGTYSVTGTGTSVCVANMSGTATVITAPAIYSLAGGTACASTGVTISLSGSESGISYQLYRGASTVGSSVSGTGSALSFGFQNTVGTYYVIATGTGGCSDTQSLRANVVSSIPVYNVTGGTGCTSTLGTTVGLDNSQAGVSYQLYNGAYTAGSPVSGTGGAISFGLQTTAGTYTVSASTTGCTNQSMTGSAIVYTSPATFTVMGGTGCPTPGVTVTLSGSASGVSYQLYNGASTVGSPVAGTGSAISFGTQTTTGVYKVVGTGTGSCAVTMSDSVTVTGGPAAPAAITGTFTTCQGASVTLADATAGGTWSSANTAVATVSPTGVVTGTGAGTVNISYTVSNGCGSSSAIAAVTINAGPAITPSSAVSLCAGGSATLTISGATSYSWAPNTNLSATVGASVVASPTSSVTYTVTGTTSGCSSTATIPVTVNATPTVASVTPSNTAVCYGSPLTLTAGAVTGTGTLISYNWRGPNSYSTSGTAATAGITASTTAQSGVYSVSVTYPGSGCTSAFAVTTPSVTVNAVPTITSITGSAATICAGTTLTLTANGTSGGAGTLTRYNWSGPATYSNTSGTNVITLNPASSAASGSYSVNVTYSGTGCTSAIVASSAITVNNLPTVTATGGGTMCTGSSVTIAATGGTTYSWTPATGLSSTTAASVTANPSATTIYTVTGTTSGCSSTATATVTVNAVPTVASITANTSALCFGTALTLTAGSTTGTGSLVSYNWRGPNSYSTSGTVNTAGITTSSTLQSGNYSVSVTYPGAGCTSAFAVTSPSVTVAAKPTVSSLNATAYTLCAGSTVTLIANSTTGGAGSLISYNWSGPNGYSTTNTATSVSLSPASSAASGNYSVYVIYSGTGCTGPTVASPVITVNNIPTITATGGGTMCTGSSVTIAATGGTTYSWTPATGLSSTTAASVTANPSSTTTYTVTGTTSGCSSTATASVTVNALPTVASLTTNTSALCYGATLTLTAGSATGTGSLVSYNWRGPNSYNTSGTASTAGITASTTAQSGVYSVSVTYPGNGCTSAFAVTSPSVTIAALPAIGSLTANTYTVCIGAPVTLTANSTTGGTGTLTAYNWSGPNGYATTSTAANVSFSPTNTASAGNYSVFVTYSGTGCTSNAVSSSAIGVNAVPTVADITPSTNAICYGSVLNLTAGATTGTGAITSYNWRGPNSYSTSGTVNTAAITASTTAQSGNYSVSVTYPGTGCTSAFAVTSPSVTVATLPTVANLVANTYTVCTGTAITLTAGSVTGGTGTLSSYNWSGPGAYSATGTVNTNSFTPLTTAAAGAYSVNVTYSGTGCTSNNVASPTVNVRDLPTVASVTASSSALCYGASLSLTAGAVTGTGTLTSYNWRGPNSYSTSGTSNIATTTVNTTTASGFYSVSVTYPGTGCTSAYAVTSPSVTVNPRPTISGITASTACVGSTLTLTAGTASGTGALVSYNWSGPNAYSVTSTTSPVSFTPTTTASGGVYTLSVTYPGTGCNSTNAVTSPSVTVNAAPVAGTISGSATLLAGTTSTLAVTGASGGTGVWSSDNLSIATVTTSGTTTTVSAISQGSANISYTVTNACSASAATGYAVSVQAQPTINSIAPAVAIPGTTITITGTNFNATAANNIVYFGAVKATSVSGSSTSLSVVVPVGATNQQVTVLNSAVGLAAQSTAPFLPIFDTTGFLNDSINFKAAVNYNSVSTAGHPYGGAIGDIDGDGKPDLVVNNRDSNTVSIFLNTGTGTTIDASTFTLNRKLTTLGLPNNVKLADIDGDGKLDIVCAMAGANFMCVFRNTTTATGTPNFATRTDVTVGTVSSVAAITDFNSDGKPDVALTLPGAAAIGVLRNTSITGTISFASVIGVTVGSAPTGVAVADLDGDGKADIAAANSGFTGAAYTGNTISIARNTSTLSTISFGTSVTLSAGSGPIDIAAADITNDGKMDLLVTNANDGNFSVFRNTATSGLLTTGSFAARVNFASGSLATGVAVADINGDTKIDLVVSNLGGTVSVFRNTTSSTTPSFAIKVDLADANGPTTVTIGDLDADKYPDVVVGNQLANTISVFQNYPLPKVAPITGTSSVCAAGGTTTLSNATPGGYWSMAGTNATISASGVVTGFTAGTDTALYTIVLGYDSNTARLPITINALPSITPGANPAICEDATSAAITYTGATGSPSTYTIAWDAAAATAGFANVGTTTLTPGSIAFAVPAGLSGTYTGTITVNNGCASSGSAFGIDIYTHPAAAITSAPVPCTGYATSITVSGTADATITYNVDGGSALTGTLTGGAYAISTGILSAPHAYTLISVANTGCTTHVDTTVIISPVVLQWVGGTPSYLNDWNTAANWGCGIVPSVTDNIIIPSGTSYTPVVAASGTAYANSITLQPGASLTISNGAVLNVKGTLTNNGAILGAGKTILNGNVAQAVKGKGYINNLEISNTNGVRIDSGSLVSVGNTLTLTAGTLTTSDSLRLYSDSSATARIAPIAVGAGVSGKVKVMQYITGGYRRYRFWSHPFADTISLSQVQPYIDVTGVGGAANGFTPTITNAPSAFRYDPMVSNSSLSYDLGWKPFTKINASAADTNKLHPGQGIRLFVRGTKGEGLGWLGYYGMYTPSPANITMAGKINQGNVSIALKQGSADPSLQDYNMVGNPYPSPVDIGTVVYNAKVANQVVGSAFYVFDPKLGAGGQYIAVPIGSGAAAPYSMQANTCFQVRAHHNGATLSFAESNKTASANNFLFKAPADYVTFNVYDQQYHLWDKLDIQFNNNAADAEDVDYDAAKILSTDFTFYSIAADGRKLAIDARPFNKDKVIPLGIASSYEQTFIVRAENVAVPAGEAVYLHDKLLDKYVAMNAGSEYQFTIGKDAATQGDNRFELALKPAEAKAIAGLSVTVTPNPATDNVGISFTSGSDEAVNINIADVSGVNVYSSQVAVGKNGVVTVPLSNLASGVYLVEVTQGNNKITRRLVKE